MKILESKYIEIKMKDSDVVKTFMPGDTMYLYRGDDGLIPVTIMEILSNIDIIVVYGDPIVSTKTSIGDLVIGYEEYLRENGESDNVVFKYNIETEYVLIDDFKKLPIYKGDSCYLLFAPYRQEDPNIESYKSWHCIVSFIINDCVELTDIKTGYNFMIRPEDDTTYLVMKRQ